MMKRKKGTSPYKYGKEIKARVEMLTSSNVGLLKNYDCGNKGMNETFRFELSQDTMSVSFIVIDNNTNNVICVYSLSCASIVLEIDKRHNMYPAVEIKFFALDIDYQHMPFDNDGRKEKLSDVIFAYIINSITHFTDTQCGADVVILYSTPNAVRFYKHFGFMKFPTDYLTNDIKYLTGCTPMYMRL